MERGLEQLFILGLILFAALVDLFVRWLKGKAGRPQPGDVPHEPEGEIDEELIFEEHVEEELAEPRTYDPPYREPTPPPLPTPARERVPAPTMPHHERYPVRPAKPRPVSAVPPGAELILTPPPPLPGGIGRPVLARGRRRSDRHWVKQPGSVRRGIVLMAILGPCRGLDR